MKGGKKVVLNKHRKDILDQYKKCVEGSDKKEIERLKGMIVSVRQVETEIFPSIMNYLKGF